VLGGDQALARYGKFSSVGWPGLLAFCQLRSAHSLLWKFSSSPTAITVRRRRTIRWQLQAIEYRLSTVSRFSGRMAMTRDDSLDTFMRRTIAANNLPEDTWFVIRSLDGSVVPKAFVDDIVKRYVAARPKAAVLTYRMEIAPPDQIWVTNLLTETVEELRYIPGGELH
jgi:hypothetical protein